MLGMQDASNMSGKIIAAVKEALTSVHLDIKIDKTGGNSIRSMVLDIDNGKIKVN
jgi:chemotaxis receptor (MCP) glutamine deamidase CheD